MRLRSKDRNLDGRLFKFPVGTQRFLTYVMLKLACVAVRDGKQIQPFAKFLPKI